MASIYGVQNILGNQYGRVYNKSTHETLRIEGAAISFIGLTLGSRSYLGLGTVWFWVLLIAICSYLEEVKLRKDLPKGEYDNYAKRTWI